MSPFADTFYQIRMRYGIRQKELAELMGYEQTFLSTIELNKKGPPNKEFIQRFIQALSLSDSDANQLYEAADASQRKIILSNELHQDVFWMMRDMRARLPELSTVQINLIREILNLKDTLAQIPIETIRPIKRRRNPEAKM